MVIIVEIHDLSALTTVSGNFSHFFKYIDIGPVSKTGPILTNEILQIKLSFVFLEEAGHGVLVWSCNTKSDIVQDCRMFN